MIDIDDLAIVTEGEITAQFPTSNNYLKYNATKRIHTDFSILILRHITNSTSFFHTSSSIQLLNIFTGNGIKLIRYHNALATTISSFTSIDQSQDAVDLTLSNFKFNDIVPPPPPDLTHCTSIHQYLKDNTSNYDIIELDPMKKNCIELYGVVLSHLSCPGLLILSVPELGLISGNAYHDKCFATYGGYKMGKHSATVESGVRLVLRVLAITCNSMGKSMHVLMTMVKNGHVKIYIKISDASSSSPTAVNVSYDYCPKCDFFKTSDQYTTECCPKCKLPLLKAGDFYNGPIKDDDFISLLLSSLDVDDDQLGDVVRQMTMELSLPFFINPYKRVRSGRQRPLNEIISNICQRGFALSTTQFGSSFIRTNCPWQVLDDILQ